jgi:hypothetical protein
VSPAKTQLKRLADQLSDEDAGLLVMIGRKLARRRQASIPAEEPTPEEAAQIRSRLNDPDDKPIPFETACREFGI